MLILDRNGLGFTMDPCGVQSCQQGSEGACNSVSHNQKTMEVHINYFSSLLLFIVGLG